MRHGVGPVLILVWLALAICPVAVAEPQPIATVRSLPPEVLAKEPAVLVRGVVTHRDVDTAIVDDGSAGIFVNFAGSRTRGLAEFDHPLADVQAGARVEIKGLVITGGYAPVILPRTIGVSGTAPLPPIRRTSAERFFSGADDCQLVEFEGIVQGVRSAENVVELSLAYEDRLFRAWVEKDAYDGDFTELVDAVVSLGGIGTSQFNARGELLMPLIRVTRDGWLKVVTPPPHPPFAGPKIPLDHLAGFTPEPRESRMTRIEGTVVHAAPGEVYVQDAAIGVRIETDAASGCVAGDRIEAAGVIDRRERVAGLAHAVVRRVAAGSPPRPIAISPDEIVAANRFPRGSYTRPSGGDYENCLVTFSARLVEKRVTHGGGSLLLGAGKTTIIAQVSAADYARLARLEPGAELSLTGLVRTVWEPVRGSPSASFEVLDRMTLIVRSADDVVLLRAPSWWTPRRLAIALAGLATLAAAATAWNLLLRRQVAGQARRIAEEIRLRREAAVEFQATLRERNRLAANLHDTVLQTVTGIGYQLAACKDAAGRPAADADRHLGLVERMVGHAVRQLRGTVWSLRTAAPTDRPLHDAVRDLAARLGEEHDAVIDVAVRACMPPIAEYVAGNLLLIAQEALLNALRHGQAVAIAVRLGLAADASGSTPTVELLIRDDGRGFDPASRPGTRQGHFGIEGMHERAERLGGTCRIETRPGAGTTVVVRMPAMAPAPDGTSPASPYEGTGAPAASAAQIPTEAA